MAKHNCFCSLLTVDVSQSKEERRAGDMLGRAGTCGVGCNLLGGLGPGRWREVAGGVPNGSGSGERPDPHPTTREKGWGFPCGLGPRCMVFQSHHADLFPSLLCLSTSTSQRGGITCPRSCTSKFWLLPPWLWAHRCCVTGRAFTNQACLCHLPVSQAPHSGHFTLIPSMYIFFLVFRALHGCSCCPGLFFPFI